MPNTTNETTSIPYYVLCSFDAEARKHDPPFKEAMVSILMLIAALSPIAVVGNALILAAVWRNHSLRTPYYILLCELA